MANPSLDPAAFPQACNIAAAPDHGHDRPAASPVALSTLADCVIAATGSNAHPRLAAILPSLVRHLHAFALECRLTMAEWAAGVEFINECGRMSDEKRNETQLLCDILGLESLVDGLDSQAAATSTFLSAATPSAILGPFYRQNAPDIPYGGSIVRSLPTGDANNERALIRGCVRSAETGQPLTGDHAAIVDVWHSAPNGLYEQQDPDQPEMNLRGRVVARPSDGGFCFYALRPTPYPVPGDGPGGRLLELLDRQPMRPAHIHFKVSAPGCATLVTQLFDARDTNLEQDSVFAVKDSLVVSFQPLRGDPEACWTLNYDFYLAASPLDAET